MSSLSKRRLNQAISQFGKDLRAVSQQWEDGVASLKRAIDTSVRSGPHEFKDALQELEDDVTTITQQLEQLDQHTNQAISLVELLGHCTGLYNANRQGILRLEAHLQQYGYVAPAPLQHPQDPLAGAQSQAATDAAQEEALGSEEQEEDDAPLTQRGNLRVSRVAPNTPHYVMSQEAKARLKSRVKTPGISLSQLRAMRDSSEDEEEDDEDDVKVHDNKVPEPQSLRLRSSWEATDAGQDTILEPSRAVVRPGPSMVQAPAPSVTPGPTDANALAQRRGIRPVSVLPAASAATRTPATVKAPAAAQDGSPCSTDSLTPDALLLSASFAALQAKYGGGGDTATADAGTAVDLGSSAGLNSNQGHASLLAGAPDTPLSVTAGQLHTSGATLSPCVRGPTRAAAPAMAPLPPPTSSYGAAAGGGYTVGGAYTAGGGYAAASGLRCEEDTCSLYAQLIRSKEVPTSLLGVGGGGTRRQQPCSNMMAGSTLAHAAGTQGTGAGVEVEVPRWAQAGLGLRASMAAEMSVVGRRAGQEAALVPPVSESVSTPTGKGITGGLSPYRSRSAPRSGAKERARAAQALEAQLNHLETQWERSGQAALTPRRKAAAAAQRAASVSAALFNDVPTGETSAAFEFAPLREAAGKVPGSYGDAGQAGAVGSGSGGAGGGAGTPTLLVQTGSHGRVLSPGTASLLSRVYGGSSGHTTQPQVAPTPVAAPTHPSQPVAVPAVTLPAPRSTATTVAQSVATVATVTSSAVHATSTGVGVTLGSGLGASAGSCRGSTSDSGPVRPRLVTDADFSLVPSYLRGQLSLMQLNNALQAMPGLSVCSGSSKGEVTLTLDTLQSSLGFPPQQAKVLLNCLVKLNRAVMQGAGGRFTIQLQ